jgi:tetratricopeptide (TPR) repeat protein
MKSMHMNYVNGIAVVMVALLTMASCSDNNTGSESESSQVMVSAEDAAAASTDPLMLEIRTMENRTRQDSTMDRASGLRLLRAYQDYYNKHPEDTAAINYLFEAGRVAVALGKYEKAIELLANFHDGSPNRQRRAEAAYLVAFVYDTHLHLPGKATTQYNKVIELYPESPWAAQSRQALQLVGKSDEEILKFLKEKNPS